MRGDIKLNEAGQYEARTRKGRSVLNVALDIDRETIKLQEQAAAKEQEALKQQAQQIVSEQEPKQRFDVPKPVFTVQEEPFYISQRKFYSGESSTPEQIEQQFNAFVFQVSPDDVFISNIAEGLLKTLTNPGQVFEDLKLKFVTGPEARQFKNVLKSGNNEAVKDLLPKQDYTPVDIGKGIIEAPGTFILSNLAIYGGLKGFSATKIKVADFVAKKNYAVAEQKFNVILDEGRSFDPYYNFNKENYFTPLDELNQPVDYAQQTQIYPKRIDPLKQSLQGGYSEEYIKAYESALKYDAAKPIKTVQEKLLPSTFQEDQNLFRFKGLKLSEITDPQVLGEAFQAYKKRFGGFIKENTKQLRLMLPEKGGNKIIVSSADKPTGALRYYYTENPFVESTIRLEADIKEAIKRNKGTIQEGGTRETVDKQSDYLKRLRDDLTPDTTGSGLFPNLADTLNKNSQFGSMGGGNQKVQLVLVEPEYIAKNTATILKEAVEGKPVNIKVAPVVQQGKLYFGTFPPSSEALKPTVLNPSLIVESEVLIQEDILSQEAVQVSDLKKDLIVKQDAVLTQELVQEGIQAQELVQESVLTQELIQEQVLQQDLINELVKPGRPQEPFFPKPNFTFDADNLRPVNFQVLVKQKGQFKFIEGGLTKEKALFLGSEIVRGSSAASFKILNDNKPLRVSVFDSILKGQFVESKKEKGVLVEKNKYRINSPGELSEITYKGLAALKFKSGLL